jgi:formate-dependent nitrite reductase membrane component NrfD
VVIGAYIGMLTASGVEHPMLMFITVPFGMLIAGTAAGIGSALELGLRERVLRLLPMEHGLQQGLAHRQTPPVFVSWIW